MNDYFQGYIKVTIYSLIFYISLLIFYNVIIFDYYHFLNYRNYI